LQCNGYEVIDLGVMTPAQKILDVAREKGANIIGLSGLITPSLDEMCHVAAEMERQGFDIPLLIGGATTSRVHTAVKIDPNYRRGQTVYVADASRAVGVASNLLSKTANTGFVADVRREYEEIARNHAAQRAPGRRLTLAAARANKLKFDWATYKPPVPTFTGVRAYDNYDLAELARYIDWTPFFQTWELVGKYPSILEDDKFGPAARGLFNDAQQMLAKIADEKWLTRALPSASSRPTPATTTSSFSAMKHEIPHRRCTRCASRCRARTTGPIWRWPISSRQRARPITSAALLSPPVMARRRASSGSRPRKDDYSAILLRALADRLAEAFAERLHERVRREFWAYAPEENLANDRLIAEKPIAASDPRPVIPPSPSTARKARCSSCWMPKRAPA
jgi:5-methyltetrahydrofolate--homocysteine methyltransferase